MAKFILSAFADEASPTLEGQIAALTRNGIKYIEPRGIEGAPVLSKDDAFLADMKEKLDAAGITVYSFGSPIGKVDIDCDFEEYLATYRRALEVTRLLGAENMRMFSFYLPKERQAEYREEVIRRLGVMLDLAKEAGVRLCHENEAAIYGESPEEVEDLLAALPELYAVFDPANFRILGKDVYRGMDVSLPRLAYVHVKDAIYEEKAIVPAGEGEGEIGLALDRIDAMTDETVTLTLEPHLAVFSGYGNIDKRTLKGRYTFESNDEAFDAAVTALKKVLTERGFKEGADKVWTR